MNLARFVFLDDRSRDFFGEWDTIADDVVGALRTEVGRSPSDRALSDLVGELTTRSDEFSARWAGTTCGCTTPHARPCIARSSATSS